MDSLDIFNFHLSTQIIQALRTLRNSARCCVTESNTDGAKGSLRFQSYSLPDPWVTVFAFIPKREQIDLISSQLYTKPCPLLLAFSLLWQLPVRGTPLVIAALYSVLSRAVLPTSTIKDLSAKNALCISFVNTTVPLEGETGSDSLQHLLTPEGDLNGWVAGWTELSEFTCQTDRGVSQFQWQLLNMPSPSFRTLCWQLSWGLDPSICYIHTEV